MHERIEEQTHENTQAETLKDEEVEQPGWQERIAQQIYLQTLKPNAQQAAEAFKSAGLPIGDEISHLVVRFEMDPQGQFTLVLRDPVQVKVDGKTLHFATRSTGSIAAGKLKANEGLQVTDEKGRGGGLVEASKKAHAVEIATDDDERREMTLSNSSLED